VAGFLADWKVNTKKEEKKHLGRLVTSSLIATPKNLFVHHLLVEVGFICIYDIAKERLT
jgi:hypothetical protein